MIDTMDVGNGGSTAPSMAPPLVRAPQTFAVGKLVALVDDA